MDFSFLDDRPLIVAVAGPNGAGKSTFYEAYLKRSGLPFVNADVLARELGLEAYEAADYATILRSELVERRESFLFETVFSDPVNAKLTFLKDAVDNGYEVVVCFIGLSSAETSNERVAMRVFQGGHDVPREKLESRFPRIHANLKSAIRELPHVIIYDNSNLASPYQLVAVCENGRLIKNVDPLPKWLDSIID